MSRKGFSYLIQVYVCLGNWERGEGDWNCQKTISNTPIGTALPWRSGGSTLRDARDQYNTILRRFEAKSGGPLPERTFTYTTAEGKEVKRTVKLHPVAVTQEEYNSEDYRKKGYREEEEFYHSLPEKPRRRRRSKREEKGESDGEEDDWDSDWDSDSESDWPPGYKEYVEDQLSLEREEAFGLRKGGGVSKSPKPEVKKSPSPHSVRGFASPKKVLSPKTATGVTRSPIKAETAKPLSPRTAGGVPKSPAKVEAKKVTTPKVEVKKTLSPGTGGASTAKSPPKVPVKTNPKVEVKKVLSPRTAGGTKVPPKPQPKKAASKAVPSKPASKTVTPRPVAGVKRTPVSPGKTASKVTAPLGKTVHTGPNGGKFYYQGKNKVYLSPR